jgi:hypothetical protein
VNTYTVFNGNFVQLYAPQPVLFLPLSWSIMITFTVIFLHKQNTFLYLYSLGLMTIFLITFPYSQAYSSTYTFKSWRWRQQYLSTWLQWDNPEDNNFNLNQDSWRPGWDQTNHLPNACLGSFLIYAYSLNEFRIIMYLIFVVHSELQFTATCTYKGNLTLYWIIVWVCVKSWSLRLWKACRK